MSEEERSRLRETRKRIMEEIPPRVQPQLRPVTSGIGAQIRAAREAQGLSWYTLAEKAGIPSANIVRDAEFGREVTLTNIEAIVSALGLKLELVEQPN